MMSLMGTLAKVALGVALAKGASTIAKNAGSGKGGGAEEYGGAHSPKRETRQTQSSGGGMQDMLGDLLGGSAKGGSSSGGGLGDLLESLQGGGQGSDKASQRGGLDDLLRGAGQEGGSSQQGGGLGELLKTLQGGGQKGQSGQSGGGLGGLLESLQGGAQRSGKSAQRDTGQQGGGLGGLLEALAGGASGKGGSSSRLEEMMKDLSATSADVGKKNTGSFGDVLNQSFQKRGEPELTPTTEQNAAAGLMLRAMIQAAKSDGKIDKGERSKLLDNLGDISKAERRFVTEEMEAAVDVKGLARQVPSGLEAQVYAMSVMAIDLDNQTEAQYLHDLATEMGMDKRRVNGIHEQMGAPVLYR